MRKINDTDEWIVEVDENDNFARKIGRNIAHDQTTLKLHREVMVLLYVDSLHADFLLQKRSLSKKQLPGYWTLSVTGHVDYSDLILQDKDGYMTAAARESKEEIGVTLKKAKLVGKTIQNISQNWAYMGIVVGEYDGEIELDTSEVSEVKIYNKDTIKEVSDKLTPGAKQCLIYLDILNN